MHIPTDIAWQRTIDRHSQLIGQARWHRVDSRRGSLRPAQLIRAQQ